MNSLDTTHSHCPYCGEYIELVIDCSEPEQHYIEDCEVCCRPIQCHVHIDESGHVNLQAQREDDA